MAKEFLFGKNVMVGMVYDQANDIELTDDGGYIIAGKIHPQPMEISLHIMELFTVMMIGS